MLSRLHVRNYRSLVDVELSFPQQCLLTGPNGSGKTSVWEVLAGIQDVVWRGRSVDQAFPASTVAAWRPGIEREQEFELNVGGKLGEYGYHLSLRRNGRGEAEIESERVVGMGDVAVLYEAEAGAIRLFGDQPTQKPRTEFGMRSDRSFLPVLEARTDNTRLQDFRDTLASFWLMRSNPFAMTATARGEEPWLERDGSNFALWYRDVLQSRPAVAARLRELLPPDVLPGFAQLWYEGVGAVRDLMVTFAGPHNYELRFDMLSDGQRALLLMHAVLACLVPDVVTPPTGRTPLIVWDEPDNFVALAEIQPWLAKLSSLVAEGEAQSIIISHHPEVIDYLAADTVLWFQREKGRFTHPVALDVDRDSGLRASEWIARGLADAPASASCG